MEDKVKSDISQDSVPRQTPGFELQKTACCFFLKEEDSKNLVKLNDSSALIWQVCTGEWEVGEIIEVLKESYPDAAETMERDVHTALESLLDEGVVTIEATA